MKWQFMGVSLMAVTSKPVYYETLLHSLHVMCLRLLNDHDLLSNS